MEKNIKAEVKTKVKNTEVYLLLIIWIMLLIIVVMLFNGLLLLSTIPFSIIGMCSFKLDKLVNKKTVKEKLQERIEYKEVNEWH